MACCISMAKKYNLPENNILNLPFSFYCNLPSYSLSLVCHKFVKNHYFNGRLLALPASIKWYARDKHSTHIINTRWCMTSGLPCPKIWDQLLKRFVRYTSSSIHFLTIIFLTLHCMFISMDNILVGNLNLPEK